MIPDSSLDSKQNQKIICFVSKPQDVSITRIITMSSVSFDGRLFQNPRCPYRSSTFIISYSPKKPQSPSIWALRRLCLAQAPACFLFMNCSKKTRYLIVILLPSSASIRSTNLPMIIYLRCPKDRSFQLSRQYPGYPDPP